MMATKAKVYQPPHVVRRKNGFTIFFAQPPRAVTNFHPNKDVESKGVTSDGNNLNYKFLLDAGILNEKYIQQKIQKLLPNVNECFIRIDSQYTHTSGSFSWIFIFDNNASAKFELKISSSKNTPRKEQPMDYDVFLPVNIGAYNK